MFKTIKLFVVATLCLIFSASAQRSKSVNVTIKELKSNREVSKITPLKIGETIPEAIWNMPLQVVNHPEGKRVITLAEYRKQKLIILDFWATYCKPCIKSIEKLDSIKAKLNDKMIVIPIQVYDKEDRAIAFIKEHNWENISVVNDTLLNKVVFSRYITGFGNVWIHNGKLFAIPVPNALTLENISSLLAGRIPDVKNLKEQKTQSSN